MPHQKIESELEKKKAKVFDKQKVEFVKKLPFKLTNSQNTVLKEINQVTFQ